MVVIYPYSVGRCAKKAVECGKFRGMLNRLAISSVNLHYCTQVNEILYKFERVKYYRIA